MEEGYLTFETLAHIGMKNNFDAERLGLCYILKSFQNYFHYLQKHIKNYYEPASNFNISRTYPASRNTSDYDI